MGSDIQNPTVADPGEPRQDASLDKNKYIFSVDDAIARYKAAGIPRIRRTVQRYCSNGTLDAHRFAIPYGEKYLITPESLDRHIEYVREARSAVADPGEPRQATASVTPENESVVGLEVTDDTQNPTMADPGEPRRDTAHDRAFPPIIAQLEVVGMLKNENKFLKDQIAVKDAQLAVKDRQIADQSERTRETNLLVASLHKLIRPLLGGGDNSQHQGSRESVESSLSGSDYPPQTSDSL
jgi:hypothetical protein